jgi:hypothetical protein
MGSAINVGLLVLRLTLSISQVTPNSRPERRPFIRDYYALL